VIDYSTTINRFTLLDAYSLPNIEELVNTVAQDKYYSSLDLRSAYHQVPLLQRKNNIPLSKLLAIYFNINDFRLVSLTELLLSRDVLIIS